MSLNPQKAIKKTRVGAGKPAKGAQTAESSEYTVEQLAQLANTTIRNVRAYQDRGLIPPPERRGRSGVYGEMHLSRLRIIGTLLSRGYTLASIGELIGAWEQGHDLGSFMGLESAVSSPWSDEQPATYSLQELIDLFGGRFDPIWLAKACEFGLLSSEGARFRARSPGLLQAGAELVRAGIPLPAIIEVIMSLRGNLTQTLELVVHLVDRHVFGAFGDGLPPAAEAPRLRDLIWRLRPMVEVVVKAEVARALETIATRHLGDRLGHVLDRFVEKRVPQALDGQAQTVAKSAPTAKLKAPTRARGSR